MIFKLIKLQEIDVAMSKFRREMNKWIRHINNNPYDVIIIHRSGLRIAAFMSPALYNEFNDLKENFNSTIASNLNLEK